MKIAEQTPPRLLKVDPKRIISRHSSSSNRYYKELYELGLFSIIPPIPIVIAPKDLASLGDYINYDGHHRKFSAQEAGVWPECILLENDFHIVYFRNLDLKEDDFLEGCGESFQEHYDHVCNEARYYQKLRGLARLKGIDF